MHIIYETEPYCFGFREPQARFCRRKMSLTFTYLERVMMISKRYTARTPLSRYTFEDFPICFPLNMALPTRLFSSRERIKFKSNLFKRIRLEVHERHVGLTILCSRTQHGPGVMIILWDGTSCHQNTKSLRLDSHSAVRLHLFTLH